MMKNVFKLFAAAFLIAALSNMGDVSAATVSRSALYSVVNNGNYLIYGGAYNTGLTSTQYSSLVNRYGSVSSAIRSNALNNYLGYNYLYYTDSDWKSILGKSEYKRLKKKYGSIASAIAAGAVSGYSGYSIYNRYVGYSDSSLKSMLGLSDSEAKTLTDKYGSIANAISRGAVSSSSLTRSSVYYPLTRSNIYNTTYGSIIRSGSTTGTSTSVPAYTVGGTSLYRTW